MTGEDQMMPPKRRRVEKQSDADSIDRSWDTSDAAKVFSDPSDPVDPQSSDDWVVVFEDQEAVDEDPAAEAGATNGELGREFWDEQRPPHYSV